MKFPELPADKTPNDNPIQFHFEDTNFEFSHPEDISDWLIATIQEENHPIRSLDFIFCSDAYLYRMNETYLNHHTYTDVITFPYADDAVEGDVYISADRVRENAATFKTDFYTELCRVMVHGTLHLLGYGDKTADEKKHMREKEDYYLGKRNAIST